jgi:phosphomannomutase / phosphoglucomutase
MQAIFKKYDLRGIVGKQFNITDSYEITQAIISLFKIKYPSLKNIAVGMDGRASSQEIKNQVCKAIIDSGLNSHFIGLCTTPALYFACNTLDVDAGIMITASHNPKEYNGFKLVLQKESIWGDDIDQIYHLYLSKNFISASMPGTYFTHNLVDNYINDLANKFAHLKDSQINFIIDCGNGSAGVIIPKLIAKLNWQNVTILYPEVDGNYPNHEPNPVEIKNMLAVKAFLENHSQAQFGIGLDGDCDRVAAMTKSGTLIPGDLLLGVFALNIDKKYRPRVVLDTKCSSSVIKVLEENKIPTYVSPTGHAFIKSYLQKYNGMLGGELSGHYCFKDRHFGFDDGIYAMLRLCEILIEQKESLQEILRQFPATYCSPEFRISCTELQKNLILSDMHKICSTWLDSTVSTLDGVRVQTKLGWILVRAANTEPVISVRIEGSSGDNLEKLKLDLFAILAKHLDSASLVNSLDIKIKIRDEN